jgi:hypothetical protein
MLFNAFSEILLALLAEKNRAIGKLLYRQRVAFKDNDITQQAVYKRAETVFLVMCGPSMNEL